MKLRTKLFVGFAGVLLILAFLGATAIIISREVGRNVAELKEHSLPAVKYATDLERGAFEVIQEEKDFLLYGEDTIQAKALKNLELLSSFLAGVDKLAGDTGDERLAARSNELKVVFAEHGRLFGEVVKILQQNQAQTQIMDEKGAVVSQQADSFMNAKRLEYNEASNALSIINNINAWALEIRFHEKSYITDHDQQRIASIERNAANMLKAYEQLEKLNPDATEKSQITRAKGATEEYRKALKAWVAEMKRDKNSEALAGFSEIMNRSGDILSQTVDEYMLVKQAAVEKITASVFLVREISELILNILVSQKSYVVSRDLRHWDTLGKKAEALPGIYERLKKVSTNAEDLKRIERASQATEEYLKAAKAWLEKDTEVKQVFLPKIKENGKNVIATAQTVQADAWKQSDDASEQTQSIVKTTYGIIVLVLLIGIAVGSVISWIIGRSITRPIQRVISALREATGQVTEASGQVSQTSMQLAEGTSQQAAAIEETSSSLEEITSMTRQNAEKATNAHQLMQRTNSVIGKASESMVELTHSMQSIEGSGEQIRKIIKSIDEIAFQTNLLALNAAVEAARAGEAGAGFAVVADEVRNLAMRAAAAAQNTAGLIEDTVKKVKDGVGLVGRANEAFSEVSASSSQVAELVEEMAAASREQALGIDQVSKAVAEIDKVVQETAANAEVTASAAEEMGYQSRQMRTCSDDLVRIIEGRKNKRAEQAGEARNNFSQSPSLSQAEGIWRESPVIMSKSDLNGSGRKGDFSSNQKTGREAALDKKELDGF